LGAAIGSAVVGAVQQTLRPSLHRYLDPITGGDASLVNTIYAQGALAAAIYPLGTPIRDAIVHAWTDNMHQLIIAAITLGAVNILTCVALPDHELKDNQQNNIEDDKIGVLVPAAAKVATAQA
jgi:SIT family siderophore-iron:H+ symporter-like MFS transporter